MRVYLAWWPIMLSVVLLAACGGTAGRTPATSSTAVSRAAAPSATASASTSAALRGAIDEFGAGTLAVPFDAFNKELAQSHPGLMVQSQFGGSVAMVKNVTELGKNGDVVAVADYSVIPTQMFGTNGKTAYADWYAGFASNAITFVYTDKSKGANQITADNWYQVLSQPGVQIGRSNPDTDPSGYQTLLMLKLAEQYYHQPGLSDRILANAPPKNMRDTETDLIAALESGQIDYLAIYRSDALQHHFKFLNLPAQIDLSEAGMANLYQTVAVQTKNGTQTGKPIIYAVTVPTNAEHAAAGIAYVQLLLSFEGQQVLQQNGFTPLSPPLAFGGAAVPAVLKSLTTPWPGS
jgi:molybdate/tungstate transport system substrate-binding protein